MKQEPAQRPYHLESSQPDEAKKGCHEKCILAQDGKGSPRCIETMNHYRITRRLKPVSKSSGQAKSIYDACSNRHLATACKKDSTGIRRKSFYKVSRVKQLRFQLFEVPENIEEETDETYRVADSYLRQR